MSDTATIPRLKARYADQIKGSLQSDLEIQNVMQVPTLEKIVLNMGVGRAAGQPSLIEGAVADLTVISGQKPVVTKAKTSIANFKLREGQSIGVKVTLRGDRYRDSRESSAGAYIQDVRAGGYVRHAGQGIHIVLDGHLNRITDPGKVYLFIPQHKLFCMQFHQ